MGEREGPHTLADRQPIPTEREYYQGIHRLARELAAKLKGITRQTRKTDGLTVFINGGDSDVKLVYETTARLEEQGYYYLLPVSALGAADDNQPTSAEEIARDLHDNPESCDAVLFLLLDSPLTQVRQYIKEYRKHRTLTESVPEHVHLCQIQSEAENLGGIRVPELHLVCAGETCLDDCVERFLREFSP